MGRMLSESPYRVPSGSGKGGHRLGMSQENLQELTVRQRPHLAFVVECLGLASLVDSAPHQDLLSRLDHCLKELSELSSGGGVAPATPEFRRDLWIDKAVQEFSNLSSEGFSELLHACAGNTMPGWLKEKVRAELGEAVTELIRDCLEC